MVFFSRRLRVESRPRYFAARLCFVLLAQQTMIFSDGFICPYVASSDFSVGGEIYSDEIETSRRAAFRRKRGFRACQRYFRDVLHFSFFFRVCFGSGTS